MGVVTRNSGVRLGAVTFSLSLFLFSFSVWAQDQQNSALILSPGSVLRLACETSAIGMDFEPFKTSKGTLSLVLTIPAKPKSGDAGNVVPGEPGGDNEKSDRAEAKSYENKDVGSDTSSLEVKSFDDPSQVGTWIGSVSGSSHEASLGKLAQTDCVEGCVLRKNPSGNLELWAPRPVMPVELGDDKTVTLATIDVTSLELKATVFRGNQLSVLEKGTCTVSDD